MGSLSKLQRLVIDASVIVKWLNGDNEQLLQEARTLLKIIEEHQIICELPELAKYEVANALTKGKELPTTELQTCLSLLYALPLVFFPETKSLAFSTTQIALTYNISYYDAAYLALAQQEEAILVTANPKHQQKCPNINTIHLADIHSLLKTKK